MKFTVERISESVMKRGVMSSLTWIIVVIKHKDLNMSEEYQYSITTW